MKTHDKIIHYLKTHGGQTAKALAEELGLTTMGVRQHMQTMESSGLIKFEDKKALRGRPTRYWFLTDKSNQKFPDRHQDLTVQMIDSIKTVFGEQGLEQLITEREKQTFSKYHAVLDQKPVLRDKLDALAKLRSEEGYMAAITEQDGYFWLLENHCPICAAAEHCLSFCRSEMEMFQNLLKNLATVTRCEHIIEGARRCAYKIEPA